MEIKRKKKEAFWEVEQDLVGSNGGEVHGHVVAAGRRGLRLGSGRGQGGDVALGDGDARHGAARASRLRPRQFHVLVGAVVVRVTARDAHRPRLARRRLETGRRGRTRRRRRFRSGALSVLDVVLSETAKQ